MRILYILLCISALLGCNKDLVRGVKREISPVSKLAIGFVEYRKLYPTEYVDKNFRDMLQFEFLQEGYSIIEFENTKTASLKKRESKLSPEKPKGSGEEPAYSDELLPELLKDAAGENKRPELKLTEKHLEPSEIQKIAKEFGFRYFLQGAISVSDTLDYLDNEKNSLVFLHVYNDKGEKVGMISFAIDEKNLYNTKLLKEVCKEIATSFTQKIING